MIKKILFVALMAMPLAVSAQSVWDRQTQSNNNNSNSNVTVQIPNPDQKYIDEVVALDADGKVSFSTTIAVKGKTRKQIMDAVMLYGKDLVSRASEKYPNRSAAQVIDEENGIISMRISDEVIFSSKFLGTDFTRMNYVLLFTCNNNELKVKMTHITYDYEEQRKAQHLTAEENIIDEIAINKAKNKLRHFYNKFRRATLDYRTKTFSTLTETFQIN